MISHPKQKFFKVTKNGKEWASPMIWQKCSALKRKQMSFFSDKKLSKGMKAYHQRKSLQKFGKLLVDVDQELWLFGLFNHNLSGPYSATTTTITEMTMTFFFDKLTFSTMKSSLMEKTMTQQWKKPSFSASKNKNNNYNTNPKKHPSVQCRQHEHFYQTSYKEFLPWNHRAIQH